MEHPADRLAARGGAERDRPYEPAPLHAVHDAAQAMFRWFAETPACRADIDAVRAIHPGVWDLPAWLRSGAWTLPAPARQ